VKGLQGDRVEGEAGFGAEVGHVPLSRYAYLIETTDFYNYTLLYELMDKGVYLRVADKPFSYKVDGQEKEFPAGHHYGSGCSAKNDTGSTPPGGKSNPAEVPGRGHWHIQCSRGTECRRDRFGKQQLSSDIQTVCSPIDRPPEPLLER